MNIELDPEDRKVLEDLARSAGVDGGTLLRNLVHEVLLERRRNSSPSVCEDATVVARQQRAFEELIQELDALPSEGLPPLEGRPVSENVDEYLYGLNP